MVLGGNILQWSLAVLASSPRQAARLHCPPESLRIQRAFQLIGQQGDVDVQAKYHVLLGADGGACLGKAYPRPPPRLDQRSP
jgi:hypothetical protein